MIPLGLNIAIVTNQAYTDAQVIALVQDWLARMGATIAGSAGGKPAETTKQFAVVATTCT
jgi:hypothetical protein